MADRSAADNARLKSLFVALYRDNEHERGVAASKIYKFFKEHDLHPVDVDMSIRDSLLASVYSMQHEMRDQMETLHNENQFFRRHATPQMLREAALAGEVVYQWFAFEELARTRLCSETGSLSQNWRKILAQTVGVSLRDVGRWENGVTEIPETAFSILRGMPQRAQPKPVKRPGDRVRAAQYWWPEEQKLLAATLYLKGETKSAIRQAVQDLELLHTITTGSIINLLDQSPPPVSLRAKLLPPGSRLDWPEFWLMGAALYIGTTDNKRNRGWRTPALDALGLNKSPRPPMDLNMMTSMAKIDAMRDAYRLKLGVSLPRPSKDKVP